VSPGIPVGEYPPRKKTPKSTHGRRRPGEGAPSDKHELCERKFTCPRRRSRGATHASPSYHGQGPDGGHPRAVWAAASAPATPTGATKSSGAAVAVSRGKAARRARQANATPPSRESSAAGSQATQPPPPPRRSKSMVGSAAASRATSATTRSAGEGPAGPRSAAARVPLPPSRPATLRAAEAATVEAREDPMEQESPTPVPRRGRFPAVEEAGLARPRALVLWTPPAAPSPMGECRSRTLYCALPLPKQGLA